MQNTVFLICISIKKKPQQQSAVLFKTTTNYWNLFSVLVEGQTKKKRKEKRRSLRNRQSQGQQ